MKKLLNLVLIMVLCFILSGCTDKSNNDILEIGKESKYNTDNLINIDAKISNLTKVKATLTLANYTDETYLYGEDYSIEYKENGVWHELIPFNDMVFNSIGYILKPMTEKEIIINWEIYYGELPPGRYRIIKNICLENSEQDNTYIEKEFTILTKEQALVIKIALNSLEKEAQNLIINKENPNLEILEATDYQQLVCANNIVIENKKVYVVEFIRSSASLPNNTFVVIDYETKEFLGFPLVD